MSSAFRAQSRPVKGRLAKFIAYTFLPVALIPVAVLGLLVYWYWQTWYYQPYPAFLQFAAVLLAAALITAVIGTWIAARRIASPFIKLKTAMTQFASGSWEQRALPHRPDELGEMAEVFNQIADEYRSTYQSLTLRDVSGRNGQDQALHQVTHLAFSAADRKELLQASLEQIIRSFTCSYGAIYLLEYNPILEKRFAALETELSMPGFNPELIASPPRQERINLDAIPTLDWLVSRAIASGTPEVADVPGGAGLIEAAIPMIRRGKVAGVLSLFAHSRSSDTRLGPFAPRTLTELQKIAHLLVLTLAELENLPDLPAGEPVLDAQGEASPRLTESDLEQALHLYQASNRITQAETPEHALAAARQALAQSPYAFAILLAPENDPSGLLRIAARSDSAEDAASGEKLPIMVREVTPYFNRYTPVVAADLETADLPAPLRELPVQMGCDAAVFLPVLRGGQVQALLVLGRPVWGEYDRAPAALPVSMLGPYMNLIELLVSSLEKIRAQIRTQRQLAELRSFANISQAISFESSLTPLFETIHHQLEAVMGKINSFAIALYEPPPSPNQPGTIRIPYMFEESRKLEIAPFPLGEGLTSILIRTRKPLLLDENVEERSRELGAKFQGQPAKSWLGVPMLYSGEVIGAIIVQDIQNEGRFNREDERLLSTLASQVAVVVRNARLLETTRQQAQQERLLNEITAKILQAPDISSILRTTADELGSALGVQKAYIRLGVETEGEPVQREVQR